MPKSEQAEGMDEEPQNHFFKSRISQVRVFLRASVLAVVPERHLICIFRANVGLEGWLASRPGELIVCQTEQVLGSKIQGFNTYLSILFTMLGVDTHGGRQVFAFMELLFFGGKHTSD